MWLTAGVVPQISDSNFRSDDQNPLPKSAHRSMQRYSRTPDIFSLWIFYRYLAARSARHPFTLLADKKFRCQDGNEFFDLPSLKKKRYRALARLFGSRHCKQLS